MIFTTHKDILPKSQQALWPHLSPASQLGFVLYGGTAIALQLGHRVSVDFDFFSNAPLDRQALHSALPFLSTALVIQEEVDALTVLAAQHPDADEPRVKVSFFGNLQMGRVGSPLTSDDRVLQVASLDDLMATKLKVILQRAEFKDYFDIANLIRNQMDLAKGLGAARAIFGESFQASESLKALTYFNDGNLHELEAVDRALLIGSVQGVHSIPDVSLRSSQLVNQMSSD